MDFSKKNIYTTANALSLLRILLVPVIGWLLFIDSVQANIWAGVLIMVAIATDWLDGLAARLMGQVSDLGKIIDPLADKLFIIFLGIAFIWLRDFPVWLAVIIVLKDLVIVAGGIIVSRRTDVVLQSNWIGKYAFGFQALLMVSYFLRFPYGIWSNLFFTLLFIALTLYSYGRSGIRALRGEDPHPPPSRSLEFIIRQGRLWGAALLAIIFFVHLFYWAIENNERPSTAGNLPSVKGEEAEVLARRFAPVLEFAPNGLAPVYASSYPGTGRMMRGPRYLNGILDTQVLQFPLQEGTIPVDGSESMYIVPGEPVDDPTRFQPPVYWRILVVPDETGEISRVIQYWLLFDKETLPFTRAGDWQMVAVSLDAENVPLYVTVSQAWNGTTVPWAAVVATESRYVIYVGEKSNALSFKSGRLPLYLDSENTFSAGVDTAGGDHRLVPGADYTLIGLQGDEPWLTWRGYWGGPLPAGDRGPAFWNPKDPDLTPWRFPEKFIRAFHKKAQ